MSESSTSSRRRFLTITAAASGMGLARLRTGAFAAEPASLRSWRGVALGADATLQIVHPDADLAERLIARSLAEVARLEKVFSLYRADSALCVLNRDAGLADPPTDLVRLLGEAARYSRLTDGAFDATVQPLWTLYARHFSSPDAAPDGPSPAALAQARANVGYQDVEVGAALVRLERPGAAVTLNGIAQGYITDRVAELLIEAGLDRVLVDMGEIRCLGDRPGGGPWQVGLDDPANPGQLATTLPVRDRAVATSGGYGLRFDAAGRFNHLLDPRTGATSSRYLAVSVIAPSATMADALSTGFSLMPVEQVRDVAARLGVAVHLVLADGARMVVPA